MLEANRSLPCALEAVLAKTADGKRLSPTLKVSGSPSPIDPAWEEALIKITQECLTNTLKYAQAKQFEAQLSYTRGEVRLRLRDDGIGFDYRPKGASIATHDTTLSSGLGLLGIEERCRQLGGNIRVDSAPQQGTTIEVVVPRPVQIWRWPPVALSRAWPRLF